MRDGGEGAAIRELDRLLRGGVDAADGELLWRFLAHGDGDAFEAIVGRHGPMVRGVCGRLLRDPHDADDAFQATFLVLARDGRKLRDPGRLASWLYTAARRVSLRARLRSSRRRTAPLVADVAAPEERPGDWADVLPILDAELARLPASQRDVLTLCLLGGASEQEAARRLDCPVGTVKSRLSRGRDALRGRLIRRGVVPAVATAAASSTASFASAVPVNLTRATLAAAFSGGPIPTAVAALASGALPMLSKTTAIASTLIAGLGLLGWSAAAWTPGPPPAQAPNAPAPPVADRTTTDEQALKDNRLKQIGLALHNYAAYASTDNEFPPQALRATLTGPPVLSWRVAILPYIGEEALYAEFHLDEPWDGPHNSRLIPRMPEVFQAPDLPAPPGKTRFQAFWGPGAIFPWPVKGSDGVPNSGRTRFAEIRDGLSNTAMIGVAAQPVVWTEPDDMEFVHGQMPADLDATDPRGYAILLADGSVHHIPERPTRPALMDALMTCAGGEVVDWMNQKATPLQAGVSIIVPVEAPAPAALKADRPSVEDRLRRLEEKMDRLLQKLDPDGTPAP